MAPFSLSTLKLSLTTTLTTLATGALLSCIMPGAFAASPATAETADVTVGGPLAVTFYLKSKHPVEAETEAFELQNPASGKYHKFLSREKFVEKYTASDSEISQVEATLQQLGYTVSYVFPNHLAIEAVAPVETVQNTLSVELKSFTDKGRTGIVPLSVPRIPLLLSDAVEAVGGLNSLSRRYPMHKTTSGLPAVAHTVPAKLTGGSPGDYLPSDFAKFYNLNPIYEGGITGKGSTLGIITLNDFKETDAYLFWHALGLKVNQSRITKVDVDGGVEAASNNTDGAGETDLDVEQSGALAPGAKLRVYIAPNVTDANYINAFEAAASDNLADTLSTSWGEPELFYFHVVGSQTPGNTALLKIYHQVFLEMALQGQTLYAASGDSGSFDTVRGCSPYGKPSPKNAVCNAPYAVDTPASDPLVTAAGGTTLPLSLLLNNGVRLSVKKEQAWGWDYISNQAAEQGLGAELGVPDVFSTGGGGGVSSYWLLPPYQLFTDGVTLTKPNQKFTVDIGSGPSVHYKLPADFPGRNVPDISANADPESGYIFLQDGYLFDFEGGTSFVAPQLNGTTALFVEALGSRVGQITPALYSFGEATTDRIRLGDNWGYQAGKGYDNASGLGSLDAAKLLIRLAIQH